MKEITFIFDLDGTLIDTYEDLSDAMNSVIMRVGYKRVANERLFKNIGEGREKFLINSLKDAGCENINDELLKKAEKLFIEFYKKKLVNKTKLYPEVKETLPELGFKSNLFVLTNKPLDFAIDLLKHFDIFAFFKGVFAPPIVKNLKPYPDGILKIIEDFSLDKDKVYMVGDNFTDIESAVNAGVKSIFCLYGRGRKSFDVLPDFQIKRFSELKRVLIKIRNEL